MDSVTKEKALDAILLLDASIREAMSTINRGKVKLCVLVDLKGRLVRTLSDGDIRRALLDGYSLDSSVSVLPNKPPISFPYGTEPAVLLDALDGNNINAVVLVDENQVPVALVDRESLKKNILLSPPHIGVMEKTYVRQAFEDNWVAPAGPNLAAFEIQLCKCSERKHAIALSSGIAGLHLAIRSLNLHEGASVYVSDLTFAASVQPLLYERLEPVLIDSEPHTWNMSPQALNRRLRKDAKRGRLPRAIIVVHLYGQSAALNEILPLAANYGIPVIEDSAESLGATYAGKPSGYHGLISVFSFNGNKIITTSGGGALVTNDTKIANRVRLLSTQGRDNFEHYQHSDIAYNYRMSNILAGIGLGQLGVLAERVAARRRIFYRYRDGLSDIPGLRFQKDTESSVGNRWLTTIELDPNEIDFHPFQVMRKLRQMGIETRPGWKPMHMQPICCAFEFEPYSETHVVSSSHFLRALCLPTGSNLSESDQNRIIQALRAILIRKPN